jgi:hypothetical protein
MQFANGLAGRMASSAMVIAVVGYASTTSKAPARSRNAAVWLTLWVADLEKREGR